MTVFGTTFVIGKNLYDYFNSGCLRVPVDGGPEPFPTVQICGGTAAFYMIGAPLLLILILLVWRPFQNS